MDNFYGLPSGKVEIGETFTQAAIREGKEEINIEIRPEDLEQVLTMQRYDKENDIPEWVDLFFEVKAWQGETIRAEPEIHSELAWFSPTELPVNTIPNVRAAVEAVEQGIKY